MGESKADKIIWWLMVTVVSAGILTAGSWAKDIDKKVDKISVMEMNIQYMRDDISIIKNTILEYKKGE